MSSAGQRPTSKIGSFAQSLSALRAAEGSEVFVTDWMEISQRRIDLFAQATDDFQWIHVDTARAARESPFGGTIAHGFLTLSLLGHFYEQHLTLPFCDLGLNYGLNRVRFTYPVRAGNRVRGRFTLAKLDDIDGGLQLTFQVVIEIDGEARPACVAESVVRQMFAPQSR
ncbi:MAG: MaoC family dehydratase [Betaproteobacteria bacterium]|jgi:acyl dehydratase